MKKSAYFVFADSVRGAVREELLEIQKSSDSNDGAVQPKISVASIAKEIGVRWKALSDEQRQIWKDKAAEENAAAIDGEEGGNDAEDVGDEKEQPGHCLLPLSLVKKIACTDPDNNTRISAEGLVAIAKATDLLLGLLVQGSAKAAKAQKRRTFQLKDYVSAVKADKRLSAIGLKDIEQLVKSKSEVDASVKAAKMAENRDRSCEEGVAEKDTGAENKDPKANVAGEGKAKGEGAKKGRRPANPAEKSAKRAKAEEDASKGTRKIESFFFAKTPKPCIDHEEDEEEVGEVD